MRSTLMKTIHNGKTKPSSNKSRRRQQQEFGGEAQNVARPAGLPRPAFLVLGEKGRLACVKGKPPV